jgi:hypothetical protein
LIDEQHSAAEQAVFFRRVMRLDSLGAVQRLGQWQFDFDPDAQQVAVHFISVKRSGSAHEQASAERFRIIQREENRERLVMVGRATIVLPLEDVRIGDVLDFALTVRSKPKLRLEQCDFLALVPDDLYIEAFHLSVRFPARRSLRWLAHETVFAPAEHEIEGDREWHWSLRNLEPVEYEEGVPAAHLGGRWVQISDLESWAQASAAITEAWRANLHEPKLRALAETIWRSASSTEARIEKALAFVQDEIRHVSVDLEKSGQVPVEAGVVLERRFGDGKDKAFLLVQLLRCLGVSARPVLVNARLQGTLHRLLPTLNLFNHVVAEYECLGHRRWVDATIPLQGGGPLLRSIPPFGAGLPLGSEVNGLDTLPPASSTPLYYELQERFLLDTSGKLSGLAVTVVARAHYADALRQEIGLHGKEAFERRRLEGYRRIFPYIQRANEAVCIDNREANELVMQEAFAISNAVLPLPDHSACLFHCRAHFIQSLLALPDSVKRRHPFALPFPCHVEQRIVVECAGMPRIDPMPYRARGDAFRLSVECKSTEGRLSVKFRLFMTTDSVAPLEWSPHRLSVIEAWPATQFPLLVPIGNSISWKDREAHLAAVMRSRTTAVIEDEAMPAETTPTRADLPEPAPVLGARKEESAPDATTTTVVANEPQSVPTRQLPAKPNLPPQADSKPLVRRRHQSIGPRRSRREQTKQLKMGFFLAAAVALVLIGMVVAYFYLVR